MISSAIITPTQSLEESMLTAGFQWLKVVELPSLTDNRQILSGKHPPLPPWRGFNNACDLLPDRQTYYLQDVADYYVQQQLAAARKSQTK
jgi:hypothetical protein